MLYLGVVGDCAVVFPEVFAGDPAHVKELFARAVQFNRFGEVLGGQSPISFVSGRAEVVLANGPRSVVVSKPPREEVFCGSGIETHRGFVIPNSLIEQPVVLADIYQFEHPRIARTFGIPSRSLGMTSGAPSVVLGSLNRSGPMFDACLVLPKPIRWPTPAAAAEGE